jgi:CheY-like chemotaxis protein
MSSTFRNTPRPAAPRRGWVAALWARLKPSLGDAAPRTRAAPCTPAERPSPAPSGLRVLVADDDPCSREVACALLEHCGVSAEPATDGVHAVALARVNDFDLILMDMQMPELDGLGATMQIRAREKARSRPRAPVLAYTSAAFGDDLLRGCGIDGVLAKPCSATAVRECLRLWCGADAARVREDRAIPGVRALG